MIYVYTDVREALCIRLVLLQKLSSTHPAGSLPSLLSGILLLEDFLMLPSAAAAILLGTASIHLYHIPYYGLL